MKSKFRWCRNFVLHVREEFERVKAGGSEYWTWRSSRKQVLSGQNRVPDTQEAYQYYLATYRYTEDLRSHSARGQLVIQLISHISVQIDPLQSEEEDQRHCR